MWRLPGDQLTDLLMYQIAHQNSNRLDSGAPHLLARAIDVNVGDWIMRHGDGVVIVGWNQVNHYIRADPECTVDELKE